LEQLWHKRGYIYILLSATEENAVDFSIFAKYLKCAWLTLHIKIVFTRLLFGKKFAESLLKERGSDKIAKIIQHKLRTYLSVHIGVIVE